MKATDYDPTADDDFERAGFIAAGFMVCLGGFVIAAVFCDLFLPIAPDDVLRVVACLGVLSLPALGFVVVSRRRWMLVASVLAAALVVAMLASPWHSRKRFIWDLYSVQTGMTVDEVEAIMGRYTKGAGKKWGQSAAAFPEGEERDRATGIMTYRWNDSDYDSDWGQVKFEQGRVVGVEFLPD
jgi:hypothetical protein